MAKRKPSPAGRRQKKPRRPDTPGPMFQLEGLALEFTRVILNALPDQLDRAGCLYELDGLMEECRATLRQVQADV